MLKQVGGRPELTTSRRLRCQRGAMCGDKRQTRFCFFGPRNSTRRRRTILRFCSCIGKAVYSTASGRVWVCWGDLRTEHVKKSRVRTGQVDSALGSESHHLLSPRLDNRAQSFSSLRSSSASGRPVDLFCLVEQCFN